jgi:glutamine amidotransferase
MHNGQIAGFSKIKRELALAIDPHLYPFIEGSSDTEFFFFLALSLGLHEDTVGAVERAVGLIEQLCLKHEIEDAVRMSVATTDGTTIWAFRYSTTGVPPSLFYSTDMDTIRMQHPELEALKSLSDETRLVVSEPLGDLKGVWNEVPQSSYGAIKAGQDSMGPFMPKRE